jgi:class 3 adenylate cyclase/tetratricopeptide (TPR) repeat protein
VTFNEVLSQTIAMLHQHGRVSYRALKRQFDIDEAYLEDVKYEIIEVQQLALDQDGKMLVWSGEAGTIPELAPPAAQPMQPPLLQADQPSQATPPAVEPHPSDAERRQLTVMFCDLVGSTRLAEQLDPEHLREVVRDYQAVCAKVIRRFEGHIAQYLGDGLLVYFGYPQAHEDDAQRAVRSGLGIVEAMEQLNRRLQQERNIRLDVRIGMHTGLVVVGEMGGEEKREHLALGETPNIAARLQGLAAPNTVVMSAATQQLIHGFFACQELETYALKGISQPMVLYQVCHESTAKSRLEVAEMTGLTPMVGRELELAQLRERWHLVQEGKGQVILLSGEIGVGKSHLVQALKAYVSQDPRAWLTEWHCSPYHQNRAFSPVLDFLERVVLRFDREDAPAAKLGKLEGFLVQYGFELQDMVPMFAALLSIPLGERYTPLKLTPEQQKRETLHALLTLLLERSVRQPVLLIVEDLHWADPSTLELLTLIIDQGPTARLLTVLTFRPEFTPPWGARSHLTPVALKPVSTTQAKEIVQGIAAGKALPEEVLEQVVTKTDGIPLFIEELTKMVLESGILWEAAERYELRGPLPPLAIPATLHDSLMARLDRLGTAKEVAQLAATLALGREFSYQLLQAAAPLAEAALQQALAQLVAAELLYQRGVPPRSTYHFKHALIQDTAYQSLLISTRQRHHQRIAQVLAGQFPETTEAEPELLAHHYTQAGLHAHAIPYWQRAGQHAVERSANVEAVRYLTTALELLKTLPETPNRAQQEVDVHLALGHAESQAGEYLQSITTFQRAADLAKQFGISEGLAHAALGFGETIHCYNLPAEPALPLLEAALAALGAADSVLRARLLAALAQAYLYTGARERGAAVCQQAIAMAHRVKDPTALVDALYVSGFDRRPEQIEARLAAATEILGLAQKIGYRERVWGAYFLRFSDLLELGDIQAADADLEAYARLGEKLRQPLALQYTAMFRAIRALLEGRFEEAEQLAQEALIIGQRMRGIDAEGIFGMQMFTSRRAQGRLRELASAVKSFVERQPAASTWRPGLALIYSDLGLKQEARDEFELLAAHDFADLPQDALWIACITYLSEVCAVLGDTAHAATLYQLLLPYAGHTIVVGFAVCYGAASRYLGLLASTMSRWEVAEEHFQDALEMNARIGAKPWLAHTQHEYAAMLLARGQPGDRTQARSLLDEALAISRALGMTSLVEKVEARRADPSLNLP